MYSSSSLNKARRLFGDWKSDPNNYLYIISGAHEGKERLTRLPN